MQIKKQYFLPIHTKFPINGDCGVKKKAVILQRD